MKQSRLPQSVRKITSNIVSACAFKVKRMQKWCKCRWTRTKQVVIVPDYSELNWIYASDFDGNKKVVVDVTTAQTETISKSTEIAAFNYETDYCPVMSDEMSYISIDGVESVDDIVSAYAVMSDEMSYISIDGVESVDDIISAYAEMPAKAESVDAQYSDYIESIDDEPEMKVEIESAHCEDSIETAVDEVESGDGEDFSIDTEVQSVDIDSCGFEDDIDYFELLVDAVIKRRKAVVGDDRDYDDWSDDE
jgi:hypothetical protein